MNHLTIGKSPAACRRMNPGSPLPLRVLCLAWWVGSIISNFPCLAFAQSTCEGIHLEIPNLRNNAGGVACALFSGPEGYPKKFMRYADKIVIAKVKGREAHCDFVGVEPGTYAIAVIHDENLNGELDTNFFGVPKEGYGFSGGAEVSMLSAPSFSEAEFSYDGEVLNLLISLNY